MAYHSFKKVVDEELARIRSAGLYKTKRRLVGPQGAHIQVAREQGPAGVLNLCANNYLGLANHPEILRAASEGPRSRRYLRPSLHLHHSLLQ